MLKWDSSREAAVTSPLGVKQLAQRHTVIKGQSLSSYSGGLTLDSHSLPLPVVLAPEPAPSVARGLGTTQITRPHFRVSCSLGLGPLEFALLTSSQVMPGLLVRGLAWGTTALCCLVPG